MNAPRTSSVRVVWYMLAALFVGSAAGAAAVWFSLGGSHERRNQDQVSSPPLARQERAGTVELVPDTPYTIYVPDSVKHALGISEAYTAHVPTRPRQLILQGGTTQFDPLSVARVRTQFSARVTEIRHVNEAPRTPGVVHSGMRELRAGDVVRKGDVLAVVWSIEVGSKKSDLVEALVTLALDQGRLKDREELAGRGAVPQDSLNQTRRDVMVDRNNVDKAERTLRTWQIPDRELQAVHEEAKEILKRQGERNRETERRWARCELLAPRDGTIVERNVTVDEFIVDNTLNLFMIADIRKMWVIGHAPEDSLPALRALPPEHRRWTLRLVGSPPITEAFNDISYILDPNQHTAAVKGYIDNPDGKLSAGEFVSATIDLPPPPDVVEVPLNALSEDGRQSFVFVQLEPEKSQYTLRRVQVVERLEAVAFVRSRLAPEEHKLTADEQAQGLQSRQPLSPGERILTSGASELRLALEDRLSVARKHQ